MTSDNLLAFDPLGVELDRCIRAAEAAVNKAEQQGQPTPELADALEALAALVELAERRSGSPSPPNPEAKTASADPRYAAFLGSGSSRRRRRRAGE